MQPVMDKTTLVNRLKALVLLPDHAASLQQRVLDLLLDVNAAFPEKPPILTSHDFPRIETIKRVRDFLHESVGGGGSRLAQCVTVNDDGTTSVYMNLRDIKDLVNVIVEFLVDKYNDAR